MALSMPVRSLPRQRTAPTARRGPPDAGLIDEAFMNDTAAREKTGEPFAPGCGLPNTPLPAPRKRPALP